MKICILDNCFLSDQQIKRLKKIGKVANYQRTDTEKSAIFRLHDADIAIVNSFITPLSKNVFESVNKLKFVALNSTGYDNIDLIAAKKQGIVIANNVGFATEAVAEHVFALIMALSKKIVLSDQMMKNEPFELNASNKKHHTLLGFNLKNKKLGIIGYGKIGKRVAKIGLSFGMKIIAYNRSNFDQTNVKRISLKKLMKSSDIITIHLPLDKTTNNIISEDMLKLMKPSAIIVNTSREKILDSSCLYNMLSKKKIYGAGLDVTGTIPTHSPVLSLDNIIITPHSAWYTKESLSNSPEFIVKNIENFIKRRPRNLIN